MPVVSVLYLWAGRPGGASVPKSHHRGIPRKDCHIASQPHDFPVSLTCRLSGVALWDDSDGRPPTGYLFFVFPEDQQVVFITLAVRLRSV